MQPLLIAYFTAEQQEALLFMLVGGVAILLSLWLLKTASLYRAAAIPLVAIAAIQLTVGSTVYFRTDAQIAELSSLQQDNPAVFQQQETERMQVVIDNFVIYRWIEIILLILGIVIGVARRNRPTWLAIGVGLAMQAGIMLSLDYFAEKRAFEYRDYVSGFSPDIQPSPVSEITAKEPALISCTPPRPEACTQQYMPVCALRDTGIRCVTTPCDSSEWKTYGNACMACGDDKVYSYHDGECGKKEAVRTSSD